MSLPFWLNSLYLTASIILAYSWTNNPELSSYNLQFTALFVLAYFVYRFAYRKRSGGSLIPSTLILATIILLLIFSTGQLDSPIFFLLNFLLFAIALLLDPWQAALATIVLSIILARSVNYTLSTPQLINLFSLVLTTPIAILFGRNFLHSQATAGKIAILENSLENDETNTLIWLSTKAKPTLQNLLETTSDIIATNKLPYYLQNRLKEVHKDILSLHQSANTLEIDIDNQTDKIDQQ